MEADYVRLPEAPQYNTDIYQEMQGISVIPFSGLQGLNLNF